MKLGGAKFKGASFSMLAAAGLLVGGCSAGLRRSWARCRASSDRFTQLFGGSSQAAGESANAGQNPDDLELYCPDVAIRDSTATLTSTLTGPTGLSAVRYQGTITRTARECLLSGGTTMTVKVGIQGPHHCRSARCAAGGRRCRSASRWCRRGVPPKIIFSRFYKTSVAMTEGNTPFSFVAEDISYPAPPPSAGANYVFYVGFDPEGARQQPRACSQKEEGPLSGNSSPLPLRSGRERVGEGL